MNQQQAGGSESGERIFERGGVKVGCQPGRMISIWKDGAPQVSLSLEEAHFVASRLPEAMRVAEETPRP